MGRTSTHQPLTQGTGHALLAGRYAHETPGANRTAGFRQRGFRRDDRNLTTVAQVESRADAVLRLAALEAMSAEIRVPVNCGQELYDVVEVTDAGAGLSAARRRVFAVAMRYSTGEAVYEQRSALGAV